MTRPKKYVIMIIRTRKKQGGIKMRKYNRVVEKAIPAYELFEVEPQVDDMSSEQYESIVMAWATEMDNWLCQALAKL